MQVIQRIAAQAQLGKNDQVDALFGRLFDQADMLVGIGPGVGRIDDRGGRCHAHKAVGRGAEEGMCLGHQSIRARIGAPTAALSHIEGGFPKTGFLRVTGDAGDGDR